MDAEDLVRRYVELWNEPNPDLRRKTITALWTPDGANFTDSMEARGYDALDARVAAAYERYVGSGAFRFRALTSPVGHHGVTKFTWEMVRTDNPAEVASVGLEFFVCADDGRIRADYQFIEK